MPPVSRVAHGIANGPGFVVDDKAFHVTDLTANRDDVIAAHNLRASQMSIRIRPDGHLRQREIRPTEIQIVVVWLPQRYWPVHLRVEAAATRLLFVSRL